MKKNDARIHQFSIIFTYFVVYSSERRWVVLVRLFLFDTDFSHVLSHLKQMKNECILPMLSILHPTKRPFFEKE